MEGDDLLSVGEFKALLEKIPGLTFSPAQVEVRRHLELFDHRGVPIWIDSS